MRFLVASMDSGRTFAPDGEEFENMQILGFVDANSIIEARKKFFTENLQRDLIRKLDKKIFISIIRDIANENQMEVQKKLLENI